MKESTGIFSVMGPEFDSRLLLFSISLNYYLYDGTHILRVMQGCC
jgi:hypothetical protein